MKLTLQEKQELAAEFGIPLDNMLAVISVESNGDGFLPDGKLKCLFEAHIFSKFTEHKFDQSHPEISSLNWNQKLYKGGSAEWARIEEAMKLDRGAALKSASYGAGQTMGFNAGLCGFDSADHMIAMYNQGEFYQYKGMLNYMHNVHGLIEAIRSGDWPTVALLYNGKGYHDNQYDIKLKNAYDKLKAI